MAGWFIDLMMMMMMMMMMMLHPIFRDLGSEVSADRAPSRSLDGRHGRKHGKTANVPLVISGNLWKVEKINIVFW